MKKPLARGALCLAALLLLGGPTLRSQEAPDKIQPPARAPDPKAPRVPDKVEVQPEALDSEIEERLQRIIQATSWFTDARVTVSEGVVFLDGLTSDDRYRLWAAELARNTRGVAAVVNRIELSTPSIWDFGRAWDQLQELGQSTIRALPFLLLALIILPLAGLAARLITIIFRRFLKGRVRSVLLGEVLALLAGVVIFLLGLYFLLRLADLTRLALTVLGGTGILGLVVGIAFRDITENFLASIILSIQHPFREGDLVEIGGFLGYVQRLTSRATVLMTLDGNHLQIPNATVFKSTIRNYTSNPNRREEFTVGVGFDTVIPDAQEVALRILAEHPAVLKEPEPWVLVDSLGAATVNMRIYFWLDGTKFSWLKVRSSVIRQVKRAFQESGISLPDEAREVVFPRGVPVRIIEERTAAVSDAGQPAARVEPPPEPEVSSTRAEGGLLSEAREIKAQADRSWSPEEGENLLKPELDLPKSP